jgi:hypothetical protein
MGQRFLGVFRRAGRVFLLALGDGGVEVCDAFLRVRIGFLFFRGLRVRKRSLGMCHKDVGVAGFAVLDCFFRVADGLGQMVFGEGEARRK